MRLVALKEAWLSRAFTILIFPTDLPRRQSKLTIGLKVYRARLATVLSSMVSKMNCSLSMAFSIKTLASTPMEKNPCLVL